MLKRVSAKVILSNGMRLDYETDVLIDPERPVYSYIPWIAARFNSEHPRLRAIGSEILGVVPIG